MTARRLTLKELPPGERPRERLMQYGAASLSDAELLAILIRTGTTSDTAVQIAERLLVKLGGLHELPRKSLEELTVIPGLGPAKAVTVMSAMELAKRISTRLRTGQPAVSSPADAAALVMEDLRHRMKEHFQVLLLDTKNKVVGIEEVSVGSLNASLIHPREVFRPAIRKACACIILVHNHPSGDPTPSREDLEVTRRLCEAGRLVGIEVLDHVVIGDGRYISLKEKGLL